MLTGMAAYASPTIQWSGMQDIRFEYIPGQPLTSWELDINEDGVLDYDFTPPSAVWIQPYNGAQHSPGSHSAGVVFDALTLWEPNGQMLTSNLEPIASQYSEGWDNVSHKYLGTLVTVNGNDYYGWLCMSIYTDAPDNNYMIFHDWAYETRADTSIMAGAVPEPTTWALYICGAVCMFIVRCRQIRRLHYINNKL